ncbi:MAG: class I tRNA ligase family protein, partial [Candidatus Peribacteraceae bacterium]|nr:class I tRNA ligase family protein [Candidatus Peribacteraceae bacterium]
MFDPVDPRQSFPDLERGILKYWQEEDTFKRSIRQRSVAHGDLLDAGTGNKEEHFSFYDGPPFATGLPHYGHLLAGTVKDVIPRYRTMRGNRVERRFGWDCHGLPIENMIEKEHNLKSKRDIEAMGVKTFNGLCRKAVQRYTKEWRAVVERMGRWVDMDWDYRTMDADFMESIWWVLKSLWDKKLVYEGHKPMHICPRCATPLSNFEVTQGYKERTDQSVIATFPLADDSKTLLLAWTTTPWSLPGNMWLAVGADIAYVKVESDGKTYVLAEKLVEKVFGKKDHAVTGKVKAKDMAGKRYVPLFPYFADTVIPSTQKSKKVQTYGERVYKIVINDAVAVSDEEGTGIVHLTSSTGEDSNAVAVTEKVDVLPHVQMDGFFIPAVTDFQGIHVKPEGKDPMSTDKAIIDYLKKHDRAFSSFTIDHSYPHCWRCDTPLLPYTTGSWFVSVEKIKEKMLANNKKTRWVPEHLRDGRFGKWLLNARDWAISRSRYWGTPLPIWRCEATGELEVIGSRDDLMSRMPIRFTKMTVLRHAESDGNVTPRYQGKAPGSNLTSAGKAHAEGLGENLKSANVARIYCSPLARSLQTAQGIAKATGAEIVIDERLREVDFGEFEGKSVDYGNLTMVKARRAHKLETGKVESVYHFPGMETWTQVQARIRGFTEEVLPRHRGEHVIVVTHADPALNFKHFFTKEDPAKLCNQPYPQFASPVSYFWDHETEAELDLHKETVDEISFPGTGKEGSVELTLVRHCQTDWNRDDLTQGGDVDIPLNDTGRKQALDLSKKLKSGKKKFDVIVASDLGRTVETAQILSAELGVPLVAQWAELRERRCGEWNEKNFKKIMESVHRVHPKETPALWYGTPPGGESLTELLARAGHVQQRLLKEFAGKRVLVVAHKGPIQALLTVANQWNHKQGIEAEIDNGGVAELTLHPLMKRIPDVLDCWFESGSMPYAQSHYPFSLTTAPHGGASPSPRRVERGPGGEVFPPGFPADFIAENLDQTRGWFYTLMVLSTALFDQPAFMNCICGGIILAEDGKKMSKRLKNYPDPTELMERQGADALRFAMMSSPVVRAEELRFGERGVRDVVQNVLLPLWNTYAFFVTYANAAKWEATATRRSSSHPLDTWIRAEVQDLVNRMTEQLDNYDLSATCGELHDTIDALTNWYVRLSRRRFAGKAGLHTTEEAMEEMNEGDRMDAISTLHDVLLTLSQLLAPFCPFITESIYLNLVPEEHGSIHLTDWPAVKKLSSAEEKLIAKTRVLRTVASLGFKIRSAGKIKLRQPLAKATVAVPPSLLKGDAINSSEIQLLQEELNVQAVDIVADPGAIAQSFAQVDARKVGPRLGARVQEIIQAGKRGDFAVQKDGSVLILDEVLGPDEVAVMYRGREGEDVAADKGIV